MLQLSLLVFRERAAFGGWHEGAYKISKMVDSIRVLSSWRRPWNLLWGSKANRKVTRLHPLRGQRSSAILLRKAEQQIYVSSLLETRSKLWWNGAIQDVRPRPKDQVDAEAACRRIECVFRDQLIAHGAPNIAVRVILYLNWDVILVEYDLYIGPVVKCITTFWLGIYSDWEQRLQVGQQRVAAMIFVFRHRYLVPN